MSVKRRVLELTQAIVRGDWEEGTEPMVAFLELLEQGYDPDDAYAVFGKEAEAVYQGKLLECLREASRLSSEGYFVVMPVADQYKIPTVEVH